MGKIKTLNKQSLLAVPRKKQKQTKFKDNLNKRLTGFKRILTNNSLLTLASKTKKKDVLNQNDKMRRCANSYLQKTKKTVNNSWSASFHRVMDSQGRLLSTGEA